MLTRLQQENSNNVWFFEDSEAEGEGWMVRLEPDRDMWSITLICDAEQREFQGNQMTKLISLPLDPRTVPHRESLAYRRLEENLYATVKATWGFPPLTPER